MTANPIKTLRSGVALTQAAFAEKMGLPFRTLQDIESGQSATRPVHLAAAKWAVVETVGHEHIRGMSIPEELIEAASNFVESVALRDACPVCKRPGAKMAGRTGGDYSEYTCSNCGTYRISGTAEAMWGARSPIEHFRALARAQAAIKPEKIGTDIPVITSYCLNDSA